MLLTDSDNLACPNDEVSSSKNIERVTTGLNLNVSKTELNAGWPASLILDQRSLN